MKQYLEAVVAMGLVLVGLGGIAYNLFREGGWLERLLARVIAYGMDSPAMLLLGIGTSISLALWWRHDRISRGHSRKAPTYVLYAVMIAGAYFLGQFALQHV